MEVDPVGTRITKRPRTDPYVRVYAYGSSTTEGRTATRELRDCRVAFSLLRMESAPSSGNFSHTESLVQVGFGRSGKRPEWTILV